MVAKAAAPGEAVDLKGTETLDITPSPRILKLIAEIEFRPWQCIAELVDNSFDEFLDIKRSQVPWTEPLEVSVSLPSQRTALDRGQIAVEDNGRGMTLEQVRNAVRAGFTGKDPITNLGLFGMGFNVATARLGGVTRFLTTRAGDTEWVGVEIDVDNMGDSFRAPVVHVPKESPKHQGTRVEITRLTKLADWLTKPGNQTGLRKTLGGIYSYLLDTDNFRLLVNGIATPVWRHPVWSRERSVTRRGEVIPAIIDIDEDLGERAVCRTCGAWQPAPNTECEQCDSTDLEVRRRRVHGWVGILRELDRKEFGIDFLRNGRKILRFDKEIFRWKDPDDPSGVGEIEYPIEIPANEGRIVGEIHLDHVHVTYTKDAFDSNDPAWHGAIRILRGDGPMQPKKAAALGYGRNDSPLSRLYRGYRRNDPGREYLMAGNGRHKRARLDTKDWVRQFHMGAAEYQTDEKWLEAVVEHDRLVAARQAEADAAAAGGAADDPTTEFLAADDDASVVGDANEDDGAASEDETGEEDLTDEQRLQRLLATATPIPELNGEFSATGVGGRPIRLRAVEVRAPLQLDGRRVPVWVTGELGGSFVALVDLDHPHFRLFDDEPEDVVLMEVAQNLIIRARGTTVPISAVFAELKARHLPSHAIDAGKLIPDAAHLMHDIQERMVRCIQDNPQRPWENALVEAERHITHERVTEILRTAEIQPVIYSGEYLLYVPPAVIPRVIEEWPEAFLDGRLFTRPFADVPTPGARRQMVSSVTGLVSDLAWLTANPVNPPRDQMIRARLSLRLLPNELAEG